MEWWARLLQVHYLQLPGSCDDVMWPTVASKLRIVGATLDGRLTGTATGEAPAVKV